MLADIKLTIDHVQSDQVEIDRLQLSWSTPDQPVSGASSQVTLEADRVDLSGLPDTIHPLRVHCADLRISVDNMQCANGKFELPLRYLDQKQFGFSTHLNWQDGLEGQINIPEMRAAKGTVAMHLITDPKHWQFSIRTRDFSIPTMVGWVPDQIDTNGYQVSKGRVTMDLNVIGEHGAWSDVLTSEIRASVKIQNASGGHESGLQAFEDLNLDLKWVKQARTHLSDVQLKMPTGGVYVDPVFVDLSAHPVEMQMQIDTSQVEQLRIPDFRFEQSGIGEFVGQARIEKVDSHQLSDFQIEHANFDLAVLSEQYFSPLLVATAWEGVQLKGQVVTQLSGVGFDLNKLKLKAEIEDVSIVDPLDRIAVEHLQASVFWNQKQPSRLQWQSARMFAIQLGALDMPFEMDASKWAMLQPIMLPVLDGELHIGQLTAQNWLKPERKWLFDGYLTPVSLTKLSQAFAWTPMQGTVSAVIPSITYQKDTLSLGGTMLARVFDGQLLLRHLSAQGLLSAYPIVEADIEMNNLDLDLVTRQFKFGSIEGRLDGRVDDLLLENWRPVAFDAWLGTPEDDRSRHRISQKAIENISDLGGVGVAGALSRSFMRFFDTFGYRRIGIGCVLSNGVCLVQGVTPAKNGYYLVEGGGLPRIDIIGHNRKILWRVFLQRLERILASGPSETKE